MSLGDFLVDQSLGSWADEMEDMPVGSGPAASSAYGSDRRGFGSGGGFNSDRGYERNDRGFAIQPREELPLPTRPPYTAHLGNLSFDATEGDVTDFFTGCEVTSVRIVEDKLERKPKGFGYVEFASLDGLKKALALSGTQFQGRNIRISVAEPPKDRPEQKDMSDWTRKGPLPDLPGRRTSENRSGGYRGGFEDRSDMGSEAGGRRRGGFENDGKVRDFGNWERKGPLSPVAGAGPFREGRQRTHEGPFVERRRSPAWGEGRSQDGSRPPRREFQERPERQPTAAELDNQWRARMRPEVPAKSPSGTPETSVPSSPVPQPAAPATRPKLNLAKRTVSESDPAPVSSSSDSKSNPFGAARPIDTAAREREVEEKRQALLRAKREAEEKAREEKKAKELAEKAAAKEKSAVPATPTTEKSKESNTEEKPASRNYEILRRAGDEGAEPTEGDAPVDASANGNIVQDKAVKPNEVVREPSKTEGSWRRKSNDTPAPAGSTTENLEEEGWSTVPAKSNKYKGRGRAIAS
ncbi:RNA-binding domain-containing protein [Westerdykella ornata]|uniref:RNA-binding domain-containing protein n=1 Tax=Westerdykella ornata TaxID=318751 RepID=A0A6A6JII1_WESOR|nr:RNA-binding domain-containing protein [Westerdykella ornata]KAF2276371.1 RNA-binding domain-containing protein [Westerdykella ornata]